MPTLGRNDKCHCGSGKKYKNCCLQKDLEQEREKASLPPETPYEENPAPRIATWKIFVAVTAVLTTIALVLFFGFGLSKISWSVWGCGMLVLIVYAAFRNEPTVRKEPGDAGNIDFGN